MSYLSKKKKRLGWNKGWAAGWKWMRSEKEGIVDRPFVGSPFERRDVSVAIASIISLRFSTTVCAAPPQIHPIPPPSHCIVSRLSSLPLILPFSLSYHRTIFQKLQTAFRNLSTPHGMLFRSSSISSYGKRKIVYCKRISRLWYVIAIGVTANFHGELFSRLPPIFI